MRGRYTCGWGGPSARGHRAHLGASGLLIGGDTQLRAIHHRPLRPLDNSYDSGPAAEHLQLATSIILQSKPPSMGADMAGLLGDRLEWKWRRPGLLRRQMYTKGKS